MGKILKNICFSREKEYNVTTKYKYMKIIIKFWNFRWFEYKNEELKSKGDRVEFNELLNGEFIKICDNKKNFYKINSKIWQL